MIVKKFTADTMKEAMLKVKDELGSDAIILKSEKKAKGGVFDFGDTVFEFIVTAAIDRVPLKVTEDIKKKVKYVAKENLAKAKKEGRQFIGSDDNKSNSVNGKLEDIAGKFKIVDLKSNLKEIEGKLDTVADHIKYNEMPNLPETLVPFYIKMKNSSVDEKIIKDIMMNIYMNFKGKEFDDKVLIEKEILKQIKSKLNTSSLKEKKVFTGPRVIALVGPTGVGKTTTIAKLAFNKEIFGDKKVALITADTYRIAAIEQLKTYSNITQIPLEIVYKPDQIKKALKKFKNYDIVLVDTAGRSQRNLEQLSELKNLLYEGGIIDVFLVLSMTTRDEDQKDIINRFSAINFNRIVYTKLDETTGFGGMLNSSVNYNVPISVLTYGQNVPDDIDVADKDKIAKMILYPEIIISSFN